MRGSGTGSREGVFPGCMLTIIACVACAVLNLISPVSCPLLNDRDEGIILISLFLTPSITSISGL